MSYMVCDGHQYIYISIALVPIMNKIAETPSSAPQLIPLIDTTRLQRPG